MLKNFLGIFLVLALPFCAQAQTADEFFELGVRAYDGEKYAEAAKNFEASANMRPSSAAFHNAGNAYVKLSKPGLARLNYERARYLKPRAPETSANLANIIAECGDKQYESLADTIFGEFSNSEWLCAISISFWGAVICFFILPPFIGRRSHTKYAGIFFAAILIVSLTGCAYWAQVRSKAVSIGPDAVLRISPAANAPAICPMPEGKSAKIQKRKGAYIFVKMQNDKIGWAKTDEVKPVW